MRLSFVLGVFAICVVAQDNITIARDLAYFLAPGPFRTRMVAPSNPACTVWFPDSAAPVDGWPVFHYVCGTGGWCDVYEPTLQLIASHGYAASCNIMDITRLMPNTHACMRAIVSGGAALGVRMNPRRIVTGGHSGGGPVALWAANVYRDNVIGYVGHHAAAVPLVNRPTDEEMRGLNPSAQVMIVCGTLDIVPFCGCITADGEYFRRLPAAQSKFFLSAPSQHITGVIGDSGRQYSGGHINAFLAWLFRGDREARTAMATRLSGYSHVDLLRSFAEDEA